MTQSSLEEGDFISPIFLKPKKDGSYRMILNLKELNASVEAPHFKMESIRNIVSMVHRNVWMASVDLKDAFFSIPICEDDIKYLKFLWDGRVLAFLAMPNGYSDAMRIFTKILKPPFKVLREQGHLSVVYVDDVYLQSDTRAECCENILDTLNLLLSLGFTIKCSKSIFEPTQKVIALGFVIDSKDMTITVTSEKKQKIKDLCLETLNSNKLSIRDVAQLIGNLVATFQAVPFGPIYYRSLEIDKINALRQYDGDFDTNISLSTQSRSDISWWIDNIDSAFKSIIPLPIDIIIYTDASKAEWGANMGTHRINGRWDETEAELHTNILELMAVEIAILAFCKNEHKKHIRFMIDNMTAVSYLQNMGGIKSLECNELSRNIWKWAEPRKIWLSAAHIPGTENCTADNDSREFDDSTEWMVSDFVFKTITDLFGTPAIDLFATRLNHKLPIYVSWKPDPYSVSINAFSVSWSQSYVYCFPPFSVIWKVLKKIRDDTAEAIMIVPHWPTQSWFPAAIQMCIAQPLVFRSQHLKLPGTAKKHPLSPKLELLALHVSGNTFKTNLFCQRQKKLSLHPGGIAHRIDTPPSLKNGKPFVVKGVSIPCLHLSQT